MNRIKFVGAAREVTGSCHLLELNGKKILLDCGFKQGEGADNSPQWPFRPQDIDAVVLSHAHIDHSGHLPTLVSQGFKGRIYATEATRELARVLLLDSAKIQEEDHENGRTAEPPLYGEEDVHETVRRIEPHPYEKSFELPGGATGKFYDAGHILGSAVVVLEAGKTICYTGDLGHGESPILGTPQVPREDVDYLIMESTYGGEHRGGTSEDAENRLAELVESACVESGGRLLIPVFAVGRAQEILYTIRKLKESGRVPEDIPVYLDSPMATRVTDLHSTMADYLRPEFYGKFVEGDSPFEFDGFEPVRSNRDSSRLAEERSPAVVLAASGMVEGGRVMNHISRVLKDDNSTICFVGFQVKGTLGRDIRDGNEEVVVGDTPVEVKCGVESLPFFSAHADTDGLMKFFDGLDPLPYKTFAVHGEPESCEAVVSAVAEKKARCAAPSPDHEEAFGGVTEVVKEQGGFKMDLAPDFVRVGSRRFAPVVGVMVEDEDGTLRLTNESEIIPLWEDERRSSLVRFNESLPVGNGPRVPGDDGGGEDSADMAYEEFCDRLKELARRTDEYGDSIMTKALARDLCGEAVVGANAVIRMVNSKEEKGKFNIEDPDTIAEFCETVRRAVMSLNQYEFREVLSHYNERDCI